MTRPDGSIDAAIHGQQRLNSSSALARHIVDVGKGCSGIVINLVPKWVIERAKVIADPISRDLAGHQGATAKGGLAARVVAGAVHLAHATLPHRTTNAVAGFLLVHRPVSAVMLPLMPAINASAMRIANMRRMVSSVTGLASPRLALPCLALPCRAPPCL